MSVKKLKGEKKTFFAAFAIGEMKEEFEKFNFTKRDARHLQREREQNATCTHLT